jgi:phospholipid/cholesterol/gamma-HCH transport system ATP-binding protein
LLRQILGLMKPDSGSICINGVDITSCTAAELKAVRRQIGVTFQESALFSSLTVQENAALPLEELTGLANRTISLMVWMKLRAVGLAEAARLFPSELSGGMSKRAAIARAMALDPEILVFDEPSAGLDPIVAAGLDELILYLKQSLGITMLVATHVLESAFRIADRIAMLHQGRLIATGTKEELRSSNHPRIRQFLDRKSDLHVGEARFTTDYLTEFYHEH